MPITLTPSQRPQAVRNASAATSVSSTDSPACRLPNAPSGTLPGRLLSSSKLQPAMSTGWSPTLVNSMNSPSVPWYMYSVMRTMPPSVTQAENGCAARVLRPGLPRSPPAEVRESSASPSVEATHASTLSPPSAEAGTQALMFWVRNEPGNVWSPNARRSTSASLPS